MSWLQRLRPRRPPEEVAPSLPDPSMPTTRRGTWSEAALTNVDITELVKRQIGTDTRPWQR